MAEARQPVNPVFFIQFDTNALTVVIIQQKGVMPLLLQLNPRCSSTSAFARRARRCSAEPSRASSIRSCRDSGSKNPARITIYTSGYHCEFLQLLFGAITSFGLSSRRSIHCTIWYIVRQHWLIALTMTGMLAVSYNQAFWRSCVRYDLLLMPFFYAALLADNDNWNVWRPRLIVTGGIVQFGLQIYFAQAFMKGDWAF